MSAGSLTSVIEPTLLSSDQVYSGKPLCMNQSYLERSMSGLDEFSGYILSAGLPYEYIHPGRKHGYIDGVCCFA